MTDLRDDIHRSTDLRVLRFSGVPLAVARFELKVVFAEQATSILCLTHAARGSSRSRLQKRGGSAGEVAVSYVALHASYTLPAAKHAAAIPTSSCNAVGLQPMPFDLHSRSGGAVPSLGAGRAWGPHRALLSLALRSAGSSW